MGLYAEIAIVESALKTEPETVALSQSAPAGTSIDIFAAEEEKYATNYQLYFKLYRKSLKTKG